MVLVAWMLACGGGEPEPPPPPVPSDAPAPAEPEAATDGLLAASHILVAFDGAVGAEPGVTRTEEEARALAAEIRQQLVGGASFDALAAQYSDDPLARRGGHLGIFEPEAVDAAFAQAIEAIAVGGITPPFRTAFGWHVARRDPCEVVHARHILVSYEGARQSSETHTKAHARRMLDMLDTRLERGADFAELAAEYSNDTTADDGGDLGPLGDGQLLPVLEEAIHRLKPGQRTIVESPYGWHLVERTE